MQKMQLTRNAAALINKSQNNDRKEKAIQNNRSTIKSCPSRSTQIISKKECCFDVRKKRTTSRLLRSKSAKKSTPERDSQRRLPKDQSTSKNNAVKICNNSKAQTKKLVVQNDQREANGCTEIRYKNVA